MIARPSLFEGMGEDFAQAFGNVDAVFTIDGVPGEPVRAILRQRRENGLVEEGGFAVEGDLHTLAVPASAVAGIASGRDRVTIDGVSYGVGNRLDDGRAMARFVLDGDI